jgi:integral membrane protein (TIGR00529 family)
MLLWVGFALSVVLLLFVSRKDLAFGMAIAAVVLGVFALSPAAFGGALLRALSDPSVLLLALVVGTIPLIGGLLERSGEMDRLVSNLRIGIRPFLVLAPALIGMLPMPGGTLFSAPLVERGAGHEPSDVKAAVNVWFRHTLLPIYPLGAALIASAKIAGFEVYNVIPAMLPVFALNLLLGYIFLLRRVNGRLARSGPFSLPGLLVPLAIILIAPAIDLVLKYAVALPYAEIGTAAGVLTSLALAIAVARPKREDVRDVAVKMKPWKFAAIILAMFAFLEVFQSSGLPERIAAMTLPPVVLCVVIGFALGLITGRIQAPMAIVVPIYISTYGGFSTPAFAVTFFAVFLGFILTPIHPCVSVSLEYFKTSLSSFLWRLAAPAGVGWCVALVAGLFVL